jgi:coproporphyrinogen III oxidase-like Fe-S oxidoreductase
LRYVVEHLYVHVPFCAAKCPTAFYSGGNAEDGHLWTLLPAGGIRHTCAKTIFFGGGTPAVAAQ